MRNNYQFDYENELDRVKAELQEKAIRLRDISASTSNEDTVRFTEYLKNAIAELTKRKVELELTIHFNS